MRHAEKHPELIVSAPITSGNVGISSASDHAESRGRRHGCRGGFWCGVASGVRWLLASGWLPALGGFRRWVASGIGWLLVWLSVSGGFWCRGSFWGGFWGGFWHWVASGVASGFGVASGVSGCSHGWARHSVPGRHIGACSVCFRVHLGCTCQVPFLQRR